MLTGVHQGSDDRTAVYIVYKRPTRLVKSASTSIFADDTNLSSKANTQGDKLNNFHMGIVKEAPARLLDRVEDLFIYSTRAVTESLNRIKVSR